MRLQTKYGPQVAETICTGIEYDFDKERPTLAAPKAEDAETRELENEANMIIYKAEVNDWVSQKLKYGDYIKRSYLEVIEWCSEAMQRRIRERVLIDAKIENDPVRLLEEIKQAVHQPARAVYEFSALIHTLKNFELEPDGERELGRLL